MPLEPIVSLSTPRLLVRPVVQSDLNDLLEINGDPEVTRFLPYATWQSLDDGAAWLARMNDLAASGSGQQLVVVHVDLDTIIGTVLLFKFDEQSARLELGYALGRKYWRQGFMREALLSVCGHAYAGMAIRRIEAEVDPENVASNLLLLNIGFRLEGTLRKRWVTRGIAHDTNFYGHLAEDW